MNPNTITECYGIIRLSDQDDYSKNLKTLNNI